MTEKTISFTLTFDLGGIAVVLVTLQLFTGILLKFAYEPFPTQAYDSVTRLLAGVPFGQFIRNIHFWRPNLLVGIMSLHGLRVFFTQDFHPPRRVNWVIGLSLHPQERLSSGASLRGGGREHGKLIQSVSIPYFFIPCRGCGSFSDALLICSKYKREDVPMETSRPQRFHERNAVTVPLQYRIPESTHVSITQLFNISEGGLYFETYRPMESNLKEKHHPTPHRHRALKPSNLRHIGR